MARDYTKYDVEGVGVGLNKRKLVSGIVSHFVNTNNPTLAELTAAFPESIQGKKPMISVVEEVDNPSRYDMDTLLVLADGPTACVSNQWGASNIENFIEVSRVLGYVIVNQSTSSFDEETGSGNQESESLTAEQKEAIAQAAPHDMNEILASLLSKDLEDVEPLDRVPFIEEMVHHRTFMGVPLSDSYFNNEKLIDFLNGTMSESLRASTDDAKSTVLRGKWLDCLGASEKLADSVDCYISIAELIESDDAVWPIQDLTGMTQFAEKHYRAAIDKIEEKYDVGTTLEKLEASEYAGRDLVELCIEKGLQLGENFDDFAELCFDDSAKQRCQGDLFQRALDGCRKHAPDSLEWGVDDIESLNEKLISVGIAAMAIPDFPVDKRHKMVLPDGFLSDWNIKWGRFITFQLQNAPDVDRDSFEITICMDPRCVLGEDLEDDEPSWLSHDDSRLWSENIETYSSSAKITLMDRHRTSTVEVGWHDVVDFIDEGQLPEGLSEEKFNDLFTGKMISSLYAHVKSNDHLKGDNL